MRHHIDPKVDCVFKALLGSETNRALLIHFLNAILGAELPAPIVAVEILNPYNEREFLDDKLTIVDIKARDDQQCQYQVELQLLNHRDLLARIYYSWADLYSAQLQSGEGYHVLYPTYAIWLLGENLLSEDLVADYAHTLRLRDARGRSFLDHGGIWLLELRKFQVEQVTTEQERWLKFFIDGARLDSGQLPSWMQTNEMRKAMQTLTMFSEKEQAYHAYQVRQNYLREQCSIQQHLEALQTEIEQERAAKEQERAEKEQERTAKEAALAEVERLKALLEQLEVKSSLTS